MIMHAKYQCSIINTSEDMSQVKVFVTDGQTDRRVDRGTDGRMRFNVPTLKKRGTKSCRRYKSIVTATIGLNKLAIVSALKRLLRKRFEP